jgi:hypothetical protein
MLTATSEPARGHKRVNAMCFAGRPFMPIKATSEKLSERSEVVCDDLRCMPARSQKLKGNKKFDSSKTGDCAEDAYSGKIKRFVFFHVIRGQIRQLWLFNGLSSKL